MSTWEARSVTCPSCGAAFEVELLKGMHITRLPEVREAIRRGTFQAFACPECRVAVGVERPTIYTDFEHKQYVALEPTGAADVAESRALHQRVFDECFLFGPDVAEELSLGMTRRLVFGMRALREKILAWDAGLDDRALEGCKLAAMADRDWDPVEVEMRLLAVHDRGGHLLFGAYPLARYEHLRGVRVVPNAAAIGHVTLVRETYEAVLSDLGQLREDAPWIFNDWLVDASIGAVADAA